MEWISVADKMPTSGDNVLLSTTLQEVTLGHYLPGFGWWSEEWGWLGAEVTHWMPKPDPAKRS